MASLRALRESVLAARAVIVADLRIDETSRAEPLGRSLKKRTRTTVPERSEPTRVSSRRREAVEVKEARSVSKTVDKVDDDEDYYEVISRKSTRASTTRAPRPGAAAAASARAARAAAATEAGAAEDVLIMTPDCLPQIQRVALGGGASAVAGAAPSPDPLDAATLIKCVVSADTQLRAFVEGPLNQRFVVARSYHEFKPGTSVYTTDGFLVEDSRTGAVYAGRDAHAAVGAERVERKAKMPPPLPPHFRLYLLSRSHTRKLRKGQRFIYALFDAEQ